MIQERHSGILLHITSLPSAFGIGDLGPEAYAFADFLKESGQRYWQILPLNPTDPVFGNSPYSSNSAFAGNTLLISPEILVGQGLLAEKDLGAASKLSRSQDVDYKAVEKAKVEMFFTAYGNLKKNKGVAKKFEAFCKAQKEWLDDYVLFVLLKNRFQKKTWSGWPAKIRDRDPEVLADVSKELQEHARLLKFLQFLFFDQYADFKSYCQSQGLQIIGDIPVYVNYDSADAWSHPEIFKLDENKRMVCVSGVPPDYFSETGQRWGNPVYDWEKVKQTDYAWWIQRISHNLLWCDHLRIDHFRGFNAYWEIPVEEKTGKNGKWEPGPSNAFFDAVQSHFQELSIIAEDLGVITPDVTKTMEHFGFPGMKVLMFAFGEELETHPYIPENYTKNCVVYPGTHDNNTVKGWYLNDATEREKSNLKKYLGKSLEVQDIPWAFVTMAMSSMANTAIIALQDILGLGEEARMNVPSTGDGNWKWRVKAGDLSGKIVERLRGITADSQRL